MDEFSAHNNHFDDDFLIDSIQNGDERAFEYLFKEYYLPLSRFAWRYVKSKAIAEELVQELFTILWEKREAWNTTGSIRSYLYKSVRNLALNHLKHQGVKDKYDPEWMNQKENPEIKFQDDYREQQIKDAISKAIEELPERGKMTYKLHRYDGLTYFGPRQIPGKRGRGAGFKTIVFAIFKRNGNVNSEIVPDASKKSLTRYSR